MVVDGFGSFHDIHVELEAVEVELGDELGVWAGSDFVAACALDGYGDDVAPELIPGGGIS